jgi:ribosomal-protein-alanine N-acetyltransferase
MTSTDAISVVELGVDQLDEIERIERDSYPTPWSRKMFASELVKRSSICIGAFRGEYASTLIGYLVTSRYVDAWHIMNVAVDRRHRRQGIAELLLDALFIRTQADPLGGYTLEVRVSNAGAIYLYQGLGFTPRGRRRGYYTDNREDALIMWRDPPRPGQALDG